MTCEEDKNAIYQGDDTGAFGQNFLTISATIPTGWIINKAEVRIGDLPLFVFENPEFPITINPTSAQTAMLNKVNKCYMAVYDSQGRKVTCEGTITIKTKAEVI